MRASLVVAAVLAFAAPARAQECTTCWVPRCGDNLKSYLKACPAEAKPADVKPADPKPADKADAKAPKSGAAGTAKVGLCFPGQKSVGGGCCWPGQSWSKKSMGCVGKPRCPKQLEAVGEACLPAGLLPASDGAVSEGASAPAASTPEGHVCESPADCISRCDKGEAGSCRVLSAMYASGAGVRKSADLAEKYRARACAAGASDACGTAAASDSSDASSPAPKKNAWCTEGCTQTLSACVNAAATDQGSCANACHEDSSCSLGCVQSFQKATTACHAEDEACTHNCG